jgi:glycosyltransferase involved in cell wall biosynthesis
MKVLALASLSDAPSYRKENISSPVDQWRIYRPYTALKRYAGWDVDFDRVIIPNFKKDMEITDDTYKKVYERVKNYDMVVTSYFTNGSMFSLIRVVCEKLNIPFVLDIDDDWFDIPDDNPVWTKIGQKEWVSIMLMLEDVPYVTTTNEYLAQKLVEHRRERPAHTVMIIPNMISTEEYEHPHFDNEYKVVIGWMGGSSHYRDFHETGLLEALERVMHEHKNVEVHVCGMVVDKYLPKKRVKQFEPQRGLQWLQLYKELSFDIGLAPLLGREFDNSKSNIKWQEYSLMGACFVGSAVGPYKMVRNGFNGYTVKNDTESWYKVLKKLVENKSQRQIIADTAKNEVIQEWSIEQNYKKLAERLELLCNLNYQ